MNNEALISCLTPAMQGISPSEAEQDLSMLAKQLRETAKKMKEPNMVDPIIERSKRAHDAHQKIFAALPDDPNEALAILASCYAAAAIAQGIPYQQADRVFNTAYQELLGTKQDINSKDKSTLSAYEGTTESTNV